MIDRCPECHWHKPAQLPICTVCTAGKKYGQLRGTTYNVFEIDTQARRIVPGLGVHYSTEPPD